MANIGKGSLLAETIMQDSKLVEPLIPKQSDIENYSRYASVRDKFYEAPPEPAHFLLDSIKPRRKHPKETTSYIGALFFTWVTPLFRAAKFENGLQPYDLFEIPDTKKIIYRGKKLKKLLDDPQIKNKQITRILYDKSRSDYMKAIAFYLSTSLMQIGAPLIYKQ